MNGSKRTGAEDDATESPPKRPKKSRVAEPPVVSSISVGLLDDDVKDEDMVAVGEATERMAANQKVVLCASRVS